MQNTVGMVNPLSMGFRELGLEAGREQKRATRNNEYLSQVLMGRGGRNLALP